MNWKRFAFPAMLLFALAFYARSFNAYFVADDYEFAGRIDFRSASQYLFKQFGYNEYRPLVPLTFALDEAIGADSPIPFSRNEYVAAFS